MEFPFGLNRGAWGEWILEYPISLAVGKSGVCEHPKRRLSLVRGTLSTVECGIIQCLAVRAAGGLMRRLATMGDETRTGI